MQKNWHSGPISRVYTKIRRTREPDFELHVQEARDLITNGNVGGGMIPKLQGCIDAIENGVSRVHIMDGRIPHCLLLEIFTNKGIGTAILGENKEKFNHEDE